tara:strand:+ start:615 stop:1175 length:561 start_codon:yes stop_codon:yes gene_type:complete
MARKVTAPFTLTESLTLDTLDAFAQDTIDIASYISVGSRQALQVHKVDFVLQSTDANDVVHAASSAFSAAFAAGEGVEILLQLTDLNRGEVVLASDSALIASGSTRTLPTSGPTHSNDLYPDNYRGPEGRTIVNDQIYFGGYFNTGGTAINTDWKLQLSVRIECQIVELSTADWMAIAIQSTAADN